MLTPASPHATCPTCIPRPHDEIRRVQRGRSERMQRTVVIEKTFWGNHHCPGRICILGTNCKPPVGTRKCRILRSPSESPRYFAAIG